MNVPRSTRFGVSTRIMKVTIAAAAFTFASSAVPAYASSAAGHASSTALNPVVSGPGPTLPDNCPFDNGDLSLNFVNGNAVFYGTENKNGDWGGANAEGTAVFSSH